MNKYFKHEPTCRGFNRYIFKDFYNNQCSVQESSSAGVQQIWIGIDDADPKIMASDANRLEIPNLTGETRGWIPFQIPDEVLLSTRMLLDREQARHIGMMLLNYAKTGKLKT